VAAQFARTLASMGKRTLLVKAGLDGFEEDTASSQRLLGRSLDVSLASAMEFTAVAPALPMMSTLYLRDLVNRAAESSVVPRLTKILNGLRNQVDIVVIDPPACASSADSLFIAQFADCIVHVVSSERATQDDIVRTHEALRSASPTTLALLVNHAPVNQKNGRKPVNEADLAASLQNRLQGTQFSPPGLAQPTKE
jgi:Mrp family chromosome partitioning ATPase